MKASRLKKDKTTSVRLNKNTFEMLKSLDLSPQQLIDYAIDSILMADDETQELIVKKDGEN